MTKGKNKYPLKKWIAGAAATAVVTGAVAFTLPYFVGEKVVSVIDGDSFKIKNDQTIRLAGLDAPERELCGGKEAADGLTKKILNKRVILRDLKADRYGRVLALVYLPDGKLVNEYMVREGLAESTTQSGDENAKVKAANDHAREKKLGIYSEECSPTKPKNPKCTIKGNYNYHDRTRDYFRPDCRHYEKVEVKKYQGDDWFCTEAEARKAGFVKSGNCD